MSVLTDVISSTALLLHRPRRCKYLTLCRHRFDCRTRWPTCVGSAISRPSNRSRCWLIDNHHLSSIIQLFKIAPHETTISSHLHCTYIFDRVRTTTICVCIALVVIYERRPLSNWQWMQLTMLAPIRDFSCPSQSIHKEIRVLVKVFEDILVFQETYGSQNTKILFAEVTQKGYI